MVNGWRTGDPRDVTARREVVVLDYRDRDSWVACVSTDGHVIPKHDEPGKAFLDPGDKWPDWWSWQTLEVR